MFKHILFRLKYPRDVVDRRIEDHTLGLIISVIVFYVVILSVLASYHTASCIIVAVILFAWTAIGLGVIEFVNIKLNTIVIFVVAPITLPLFIALYLVTIYYEFTVPEQYNTKEFFYDEQFEDYGRIKDSPDIENFTDQIN